MKEPEICNLEQEKFDWALLTLIQVAHASAVRPVALGETPVLSRCQMPLNCRMIVPPKSRTFSNCFNTKKKKKNKYRLALAYTVADRHWA